MRNENLTMQPSMFTLRVLRPREYENPRVRGYLDISCCRHLNCWWQIHKYTGMMFFEHRVFSLERPESPSLSSTPFFSQWMQFNEWVVRGKLVSWAVAESKLEEAAMLVPWDAEKDLTKKFQKTDFCPEGLKIEHDSHELLRNLMKPTSGRPRNMNLLTIFRICPWVTVNVTT